MALFLGLALGSLGCGTDAQQAGPAGCTPGTSQACACPGGGAGTQTCNLDGLSLGACSCGLTGEGLGEGGGAGTTAAPITPTSSPLPCEVASILEDHCSLCHGAVPSYTAPMSLVTWEDLSKASALDPSVTNAQRMLARIVDTQRPMPQPPNAKLTPEQIGVLTSWVNGGMPKGTTTSCGTEGGAGSGAAGTGAAGTGGEAGTGAVDPGEECFDFLAHAPGDKSAPYAVPTTPDSYTAFDFAPPWGAGPVQGVRAESIIDDTASVHHWILYSSAGALADGAVGGSAGTHPGGQFVVGWAPGSPDMKMPDDVGLEMPGAGYQLEIHYNAPGGGHMDRSGVRLCITRAPRANVAATHPLGQELFSTFGAGTVNGTCKPRGPFPIHILTSSPHMHKKGTHMKTVIKRAGGGEEILTDMPFDFNNQLVYETPTLINEGDTLVTTCTFNGAASFGTKTTQEMCYNFVTAWPAGALEGVAGYTGISGNGNTCIK